MSGSMRKIVVDLIAALDRIGVVDSRWPKLSARRMPGVEPGDVDVLGRSLRGGEETLRAPHQTI